MSLSDTIGKQQLPHSEYRAMDEELEGEKELQEASQQAEGGDEEYRDQKHRGMCEPSAVPLGNYSDEAEDDEEECRPAEAALYTGEGPAELVETARHRDVDKPTNTKQSSAAQEKRNPEERKAEVVEKRVAPRKKKPVCKVSIGNVERQPPIREGVNTPRSVALCEEYGVNPSELAHYDREHFKGTGVSNEVVELRYKSFEKRRRAQMLRLKPVYKARFGADHSGPTPVSVANCQAQAGNEGAALPAAVERAAARPSKSMDEEVKMQRQFEAQQQRLLEQERRKTAMSGYESDGHHRSPQHARQFYATSGRSFASHRSPGRSIASLRSPGRFSRCTSIGSRPTLDQPYSAAKIYSASISESRALTPSETFMIEEINEREARRIDTQERAAIIQENRDLMHVERELARERQAAERVQKKAEEQLEMQREMQKRIQERQNEVAERRKRLEAERLARIKDTVAEKESGNHSPDPYSLLLLR
ncbi:hypothetical protein JKF63_07205 [Porcisia hertigi]|uniref:Uncharacterized protein n=1 Tax=Porcisia hertigi TaxID=2761500 RepID=A0A836LLC9_9TRYP|nr:hypothetical protein JKF63_07205 [Porcisia hertigi]